jgi:hypothetical protein
MIMQLGCSVVRYMASNFQAAVALLLMICVYFDAIGQRELNILSSSSTITTMTLGLKKNLTWLVSLNHIVH